MESYFPRGVSIVEMLQGSAPVLDEVHHRGNYPKLVQRRNMFAGLPPLSKGNMIALSLYSALIWDNLTTSVPVHVCWSSA